MILIAKCGKTSEHKGNHCYGHACLDNKCSHGLALVRETSNPFPIGICFQHETEIAEVLCKEMGFPVNAPFVPKTSSFAG